MTRVLEFSPELEAQLERAAAQLQTDVPTFITQAVKEKRPAFSMSNALKLCSNPTLWLRSIACLKRLQTVEVRRDLAHCLRMMLSWRMKDEGKYKTIEHLKFRNSYSGM